MTTSFNKWVPFNGASTKEEVYNLGLSGTTDEYSWRCSYLPALNVEARFVKEPKFDLDMVRYGLRTWKEVVPYLLKEFYVLTPWQDHEDKTGFTSFAYYDPDTKKGVLFIFRREECEMDTIELDLPFIKDGSSVVLADENTGEVITCTESKRKFVLDKPGMSKEFFFEVK